MVTPDDGPGAKKAAEDVHFVTRCHGLIRLGGLLPPLAAIVAMAILSLVGGTAANLAVTVGVLVLAGQLMVWTGMRGLWKAQGWASGAGFYLTVGGALSSLSLFLTGVPVLMLLPLAAPCIGGLAKRRFERRLPREGASG